MPCYSELNGNVVDVSDSLGACRDTRGGEFTSCCYAGDRCLSDGFCLYTHGGNEGGSGYYTAGCTDPNFEDSSCPRACGDQEQPDAVYDYFAGRWSCCGIEGTNRQCSAPLGRNFNAPPPGNLSTIAYIVGTSSASSISQSPVPTVTRTLGFSSGTPNAASEASNTACADAQLGQASSSGLSTGATAGIGVGFAILGLALIALAVALFLEKRKSRSFLGQQMNIHGGQQYSPPDEKSQMLSGDFYSTTPPPAFPPKQQYTGAPVHGRGELVGSDRGELESRGTGTFEGATELAG